VRQYFAIGWVAVRLRTASSEHGADMQRVAVGGVTIRVRIVLVIAALVLGFVVPPATAAIVSATPTCDYVDVSNEVGYEPHRLIPTDDGYVAVRTSYFEGAVLTGHANDGLLASSIGGMPERMLPVTGSVQGSFHLAGPTTGPRILVHSLDDSNRSRLTAFDLDGTRQTGFGTNGELVFGAGSWVNGVAERPSGALVIWVESGTDHHLHLMSANGTSAKKVAVASDAYTHDRVASVVPSGEDHVWVLVSEGTYGFQTWVDRVAVADGTNDTGFVWDDTLNPGWIMNLGGKLLGVAAAGVARLYGTNGAKVTSFGSSGEVDLSGTFEQVTAFAPAPGGRAVMAGYTGFSPERIGAVILGAAGVVTSTGASGVFGPFETDPFEDSVAVATGLVNGGVVLETGLTRILGPDGKIATDCGPFEKPRVVRRSGKDRYATAAALVATIPTADTVVIATGQDFPDALAGGAAAAAMGGPLLLVTKGEVPTPTREQLARLRPSRIVVLGGPNSVADSVVTFLQQQPWGPTVKRVSGKDRIATAIEASKEAFPDGADFVYLATGGGFADALAAVPPAAFYGAPILLTSGRLSSAVLAEIDRLDPTEGVMIVGGPSSVPYDVDAQVYEAGRYASRIAGRDRYHTAALIASLLPEDTGAAFLASGGVFADALAAGPIAGRRVAPLLLTSASSLPEQARGELARRSAQVIYVAGGESTVNDSVLSRLDGKTLGYTFMAHMDMAETVPLQWNGCAPIPWRWNPGDGPDSDLAFLKAGFASVSKQTGLTFVYQGTTTNDPYEGDSPDFVTVGFTYMIAAGLAGPQVSPSSTHYTGGTVALSNSLSGQSYDGTSFASMVFVHEIGHLLGLGHVRSPWELMTDGYLEDGHTTATFKSGDLAGLKRTLDFSRC
jgi:putative cell wall-binding protein